MGTGGAGFGSSFCSGGGILHHFLNRNVSDVLDVSLVPEWLLSTASFGGALAHGAPSAVSRLSLPERGDLLLNDGALTVVTAIARAAQVVVAH